MSGVWVPLLVTVRYGRVDWGEGREREIMVTYGVILRDRDLVPWTHLTVPCLTKLPLHYLLFTSQRKQPHRRNPRSL